MEPKGQTLSLSLSLKKNKDNQIVNIFSYMGKMRKESKLTTHVQWPHVATVRNNIIYFHQPPLKCLL